MLPKLVNGAYRDIQVKAISNDGTVMFGMVSANYSPIYPWGTVRWTQAGGFEPLADGFPAGVNSAGTSIGITDNIGVSVPPLSEDVLWSASQGIVHLGPLVNAPQGTSPTKVYVNSPSEDGKVISGYVYLQPSDVSVYNSRVTRWRDTTGWMLLPSLPGGALPKYVTGMSADGAIFVGGASGGTDSGSFIWDAVHGSRNLRQVLTDDYGLGASLAGWADLGDSPRISADGRTVYGSRYSPNQSWIAYLGTPVPEPSTLFLAMFALTPIALRRNAFGRRAPN